MSIQANFSAIPTSGKIPLSVKFSDNSIVTGGSLVTGRIWNFGDGNNSGLENPSHDYTALGSYNVSLKVGTIATAWTLRTTPSLRTIRVLWDGTQFVALGSNDAGNDIITSPDGITWTSRVTPVSADLGWFALAYGNGTYVATGYTRHSMVSTNDAVTWTRHDNVFPVFVEPIGLAYGANKFVAVAFYPAGGGVYTSTNGSAWSVVAGTPSGSWTSLSYAGGYFFATQGQGTPSATIMYSDDGNTWTTRTLPITISDGIVAYNGSRYVICGGPSATPVAYSDDLVTWTAVSLAFNHTYTCITYGAGLFVAVSNGGVSTTRIMTSHDGENWTTRTSPSKGYEGVIYGNESFVAVSDDAGTQNASTSGFSEDDTETKLNYITVNPGQIIATPSSGFAPLKVKLKADF